MAEKMIDADGTVRPYVRDEYRPGMDLDAYARQWLDMVPHLGHLMDLASTAKVVAEFGVRGAVSSWAILDGLPEDGRLYSVDIDPLCPIPPRVTSDPRFKFIVGDSVTVPLPKHVDFVMIDSSHEYDQTVRELDRAASLNPVVIALHDYLYADTPDVKRAIDGWLEGDVPYVLEVVHPSTWGLAVLRRA